MIVRQLEHLNWVHLFRRRKKIIPHYFFNTFIGINILYSPVLPAGQDWSIHTYIHTPTHRRNLVPCCLCTISPNSSGFIPHMFCIRLRFRRSDFCHKSITRFVLSSKFRGKKLSLWRLFFVYSSLCHWPEGKSLNRLWIGCVGSEELLAALLVTLVLYKSWMEWRSVLMICSADIIGHCCLTLCPVLWMSQTTQWWTNTE